MVDYAHFPPLSGSPGRQTLQRLAHGPEAAQALYFKRRNEAVSTGTYVNLFHAARWRHLTGLADFQLELSGGAGRVTVFGIGKDLRPNVFLEISLSGADAPAIIALNNEYDFFFFDWRPRRPETPLPQAHYTAERRDFNRLKAALVVTTFQRLREVENLAATYRRARLDFPEMRGLTNLFIINNQPDDAERLARLDGRNIRLINNSRNTGGAGGFGLGARLASAENFSHVLFMDDDAAVEAEAWLRTLSLLLNLKSEYREQVIGGGMFVAEDPAFCHTLSEALNHKGYPVNLAGRRKLDELPAVLDILQSDPDFGHPGRDEIPPDNPLRPYAAWWYCVIPVENFRRHGWPLPVFFRGDDQEFGLRIRRKVLTLNGIFVHHPGFEAKRGLLRDYLGPRNWAVYIALHFPRRRLRIILDTARRLARRLADNDYSGAAVLLTGFGDFQNFSPRLNDDGPAIFRRLKTVVRQWPNHTRALKPGERVDRPAYPQGHQIYSAALVILSLGGALIPAPLFRSGPILAAPPHLRGKFPARQTIAAHSPSEVRIFSRRRALKLSLTFFGLAWRLMFRNVKSGLLKALRSNGYLMPDQNEDR